MAISRPQPFDMRYWDDPPGGFTVGKKPALELTIEVYENHHCVLRDSRGAGEEFATPADALVELQNRIAIKLVQL